MNVPQENDQAVGYERRVKELCVFALFWISLFLLVAFNFVVSMFSVLLAIKSSVLQSMIDKAGSLGIPTYILV